MSEQEFISLIVGAAKRAGPGHSSLDATHVEYLLKLFWQTHPTINELIKQGYKITGGPCAYWFVIMANSDGMEVLIRPGKGAKEEEN